MFNIKLPRKKILGIYLLVFGLVALLKILYLEEFTITGITVALTLFLSLDLTIRSLSKKKKDKALFIPGVTLFQLSLFAILYFAFLSKSIFTFDKIWPITGIFPGISLILCYFLFPPGSPSTIIPGIFITFMSIIILLFRMGVFQFEFKLFLLLLIPASIIFIGLYLIFGEEIEELHKQVSRPDEKKK